MDSIKINLEHDNEQRFLKTEISPIVRNLLKTTPWKSFLDLGCGDGGLLYSLQDEGFFDYDKNQIYGVDISKKRILRTQKLCPNVKTEVANACNVETLDNESIDLLISSMVLEHVPNDMEMLKEIARLVSPGGKVYISTVFKHKLAWYYHRANGQWVLDPTHCREYTEEKTILDELERLGLILECNIKKTIWFPVSDFIFRRINKINIYNNSFWRRLRSIKVPVPGYKTWEIIVSKPKR